MRKRIVFLGVVVLIIGLVASTAASARTRSTAGTPSERTATVADSDSSRGPVTVQRLLQARLELTRRLVLALRFLDQPPGAGNGSHTIIDEPDPAGFGDNPNPEQGDPEDAPPPDSVDDENDGAGSIQATK